MVAMRGAVGGQSSGTMGGDKMSLEGSCRIDERAPVM